MRAFLAVPADAAWVQSATEFTTRLKTRLPRAAWTRPEGWHLTVKFLGEITEEAAARFAEGVATTAGALVNREIPSGGPVVLPPRGRARVLGIGFDPAAADEALRAVARSAEDTARSLGCPPEDRPLRPHVTLARVHDPWPRAAVDEFVEAARAWVFPVWRVRSIVLYRSRLDPAGAVHTPVHEWTCAAGARA